MLDTIISLDGQLLLAIQALHMSWLDPLLCAYTKLGDGGILWIALSLAMLLWKPTRKAGALALCAMALGMLVTNFTIKPLVERARPWLVLPLTPLVTENDPNSFPSGHTCAAFAAGMVWLRALPWKGGRAAAVVMAVCMGLSRLYVGVHFPTDVLFGALIGSLCAWAAWKACRAYEDRRSGISV